MVFMLCREWERAIHDTPLFKALQEIVEEETIESNSNNSNNLSNIVDHGKALHQAILNANSVKASDVGLLAVFSMMVRDIQSADLLHIYPLSHCLIL